MVPTRLRLVSRSSLSPRRHDSSHSRRLESGIKISRNRIACRCKGCGGIAVAMVKTEARIVKGDAGKVICKKVERIKPAAVVMGTRGRSLARSVLQGSASEYCFHHCKSAPIIIVPGKEAGEESVI